MTSETNVPASSNFRKKIEYVPNVQSLFGQNVKITLTATSVKGFYMSAKLVVDTPIKLGCFKDFDNLAAAATSNPSPSVLSPAQCLVSCKQGGNWRFAAVTNGDKCYCFDEMPLAKMKALKMDKCEMAKCYGDDSQFCGGPEGYAFYVAECPTGLKRFGDHCYDIDTATPGEIDDNADICSNKVIQTIVWVL